MLVPRYDGTGYEDTTPIPGEMIQFDLRIFFKWVGKKPPTRQFLVDPTSVFETCCRLWFFSGLYPGGLAKMNYLIHFSLCVPTSACCFLFGNMFVSASVYVFFAETS